MAKDTLQETMIRIIRYMKPFDQEDALWNWIRKIAKSALIDQVRQRKRLDIRDFFHLVSQIESEESMEEESLVLNDSLSSALSELNIQDRSLVEGKYFQGKSYELLALDHDLTPKAIESRLSRIRKKLKAMILEHMKNE